MKVQQGSTSAIIQNEKGEILFTKRADGEKFLPGFWELPGGGVEYGETPQESLKREIQEECGIDIEIVKPISANSYFIEDLQRIEICFLCKALSTDVKLSSEHSDYKWLKMSEIGEIRVSDYIKKVIDSAKSNLN
ncbi:MAG: Hydrolase, NUDIX family [Microgenomates group bacterium GW2011_GWA2_37_6]|nr:MAG: Hydrolase, NUDIX family [Microgenomates group bacterium GW2011_GWA2_37_6]